MALSPHRRLDPRLLQEKRILLRGGIVLTLDPGLGDFARADVLIEDGKIRDVGPNLGVSDDNAAVVDAGDRIVLPGFVDTHCHSYQGLLRGLLPNGALPEYDASVQKAITPHYQPEDAYAGVLITALGMLNMGTTTMVDISQVCHSPEHIDAVLQALNDAGLRAVYAYWRGIGPKADHPHDIFRILPKYFSASDGLLTPALAVSLDANNYRVAREAGVRAVVHLRLNAEPLLGLARAGLLREGDEFIHCTHLSGEAWRLIKDIGGTTSHSPPLEMAMGHGMPSMQEAIDVGLEPSFSCDHCATVGQDMFGIMKTAFNIQRLTVHQRRRNGESETPGLLPPRKVLECATIAGAKCAGLGHRIGTLSPGKDADLIMMRADDLAIWPLNNAYAAVVNLMNPSHVEAVFVRGIPKKWASQLIGIDVSRVLNLVKSSRDAVLGRADYRIGMLE
jgi:cytosine/adenosine deaminase-related metal-dependent hydrolase